MVSAKVDSLQLVHHLSKHHFSGELRVEVSQRLERHSNEWVTLSWIGLGFRRRAACCLICRLTYFVLSSEKLVGRLVSFTG